MFAAQLDIYERFGLPTYWAEAQILNDDYQCGRWEDVVRRADDLLDEGLPSPMEAGVRLWQG